MIEYEITQDFPKLEAYIENLEYSIAGFQDEISELNGNLDYERIKNNLIESRLSLILSELNSSQTNLLNNYNDFKFAVNIQDICDLENDTIAEVTIPLDIIKEIFYRILLQTDR